MNFTPIISRLLGHYGVAEHHGSIRRRAREQFADVVYVFVFGLDVIVLSEQLGHWMLRRKFLLLPFHPFRRHKFRTLDPGTHREGVSSGCERG